MRMTHNYRIIRIDIVVSPRPHPGKNRFLATIGFLQIYAAAVLSFPLLLLLRTGSGGRKFFLYCTVAQNFWRKTKIRTGGQQFEILLSSSIIIFLVRHYKWIQLQQQDLFSSLLIVSHCQWNVPSLQCRTPAVSRLPSVGKGSVIGCSYTVRATSNRRTFYWKRLCRIKSTNHLIWTLVGWNANIIHYF